MTTLNVLVRPEVAYLVMDTEGQDEESGRILECSKFFPIPHLGCIIASRGLQAIALTAYLTVQQRGYATADELESGFMKDVSQVLSMVLATTGLGRELAEKMGRSLTDEGIALVGFSESRGEAFGYRYIRGGMPGSWVRDVIRCDLSPAMPALEQVTTPTTPEELLELSRRQVAYARSQGYRTFGGRLVLAEIRKDGMHINSHRLS